MPDEVTWTVTEASGDVKKVGYTEKVPFYPQARATADMTEGQKEFITRYNNMRNALIKHELMEEKQ